MLQNGIIGGLYLESAWIERIGLRFGDFLGGQ